MHSDEWKAYSKISELPHVLRHEVGNHSVNFVDPASGVNTQNIESYWNNVKQKLKRMKGCHADHLPSYLDEYMWRDGGSGMVAPAGRHWKTFLHDIAQQYSVPSYP